MIEVMVPSMIWDKEEWIIRNIKNSSDSLNNLKYCDGKVKNVIFDVENMKNCKIEVGLEKYTYYIMVRISNKFSFRNKTFY